jgi:hypothetical protein
MKELNNIIFVSGAEIQSHGNTPAVNGRIRFNSTTEIWEFSEDNGTNWLPLKTTVNGMTGDVTIGGFASLTCYVVGTGGDDNTAEIGNILRPFETIGAAIEVARLNYGSLIEVLPGTYNLDDTNCPYGLMYPNSNYSYYFHPNSIINYSGTYGLYNGDSNTDGDIFGFAQFNVLHSGTFTGSGYAFFAQHSVAFGIRTRQFNFVKLAHGSTSTGNANSKTLGIGDCPSTSVIFNYSERILGRHGDVVTLEAGSRSIFNGIGFIQSTSLSHKTINITNATSAVFKNTEIQNYGNAFGGGRDANTCVSIGYGANVNDYSFINCPIYFISSSTGYKLIEITSTDSDGLTTFENVKLRNRIANVYTIGGNSIYSDYSINVKFINVYSNADIGGTGTLTNLATGGVGFVYNTNI